MVNFSVQKCVDAEISYKSVIFECTLLRSLRGYDPSQLLTWIAILYLFLSLITANCSFYPNVTSLRYVQVFAVINPSRL